MNIEEQILKIKQDQIKTLELVERLAASLAASLSKTIEVINKLAGVVTKDVDNPKRHGIIKP
jgi:hypothetical protein